MIKTDDFSIEATRSGYTLTKSLSDIGYSNIIYAEFFTKGYYEAEELLDNFLEFPNTQKLLFSPQYQDIGLAAVIGKINDCPTQVVIVHLGGYIPPNYADNEIESWLSLIKNIEQVKPSWEQLRNASNINQQKLNRLIEIFNQRLFNANIIYQKMKQYKWLTDEEKNLVNQDSQFSAESNKIVEELQHEAQSK